MKSNVDCECGEFVIEFETVEEMRDRIAEHLMLIHGATEWEEEGNPISRLL